MRSDTLDTWSSISAFSGYTNNANTPGVGFFEIFSKIGMLNASVFPEPVGAEIIVFLPERIE